MVSLSILLKSNLDSSISPIFCILFYIFHRITLDISQRDEGGRYCPNMLVFVSDIQHCSSPPVLGPTSNMMGLSVGSCSSQGQHLSHRYQPANILSI